MDKREINLTKTCSNCGEQKPLSAFLQMTDQQTITYGNICSSCRKAHMDLGKEEEESSISTTEHEINAKAKLQMDLNKELLHKKTEEDSIEQEQEKEKEVKKDTQRIKNIASEEKKHRETFLEKTTSTLLDSKTTRQAAEQVFGSERQIAKEAEIRTDIPYEERFTGKLKFSGEFNRFKSWLGSSAPIVRAAEQFKATKTAAHVPPISASDDAAKRASQQANQKFSLAQQTAAAPKATDKRTPEPADKNRIKNR